MSTPSQPARSPGRLEVGWRRYRQVLRHRNFALLWAGQSVSWFGDSLYFVSLLWLVQELTGSRALMGVVAAARTVPMLFGVFAGVAVDRRDRRRLMMVTDVVRALVIGAVPLLMMTGRLQIWHIPVAAFLLSAAGVFFDPAQQSLIPVIVQREELAQANALLTLSQQLVQVVGYAAAGFLIALVGVRPMLVIDALTFLVSVGAISLLRLRPEESNPFLARLRAAEAESSVPGGAPGEAASAARGPTLSGRGAQWRSDLREGLGFIRSQRAMLLVIPLIMLLNFLVAPFAVLLPAWVQDVLKSGPGVFGLLETAITVGMVAGSLLVGLAAARAGRSTLALGALGSFGAGALVFSLSRSITLSVLAMAVMGCANAAANIVLVTWAQLIVPKPMMGRVFGTLRTLSQAVAPAGQALAGIAGQAIALPLIFGAVGIIWLVIAAVYAAVPSLRGAFDVIDADVSGGGNR